MAMEYRNRKFEIYALHARTQIGPVPSYEEMFARIASLDPGSRNEERSDKVLGLPITQIHNHLLFFIAVEGPKDVSPLIYDSVRSTMRIQPLGENEVVGTRTHGIIDIRRREAVIEFNHRGAKAHDIEYLFGAAAR